MLAFKEGTDVIVRNGNKYEVGMILGKIYANKKTLYDVFLESRSVITAVPRNGNDVNVYIDDVLTKQLINDGDIKSTLPDYHYMLEEGLLPAYRENVVGPRSY